MSVCAVHAGCAHQFDNGVRVYRRHLQPHQIERYARRNLHEPVEEEWFSWAVFSATRPRPVVVDVGAAIGYYSLLARRINSAAHIHAFEPLAVHRRYLRQNIRLNGLPLDAIQIHPQALSANSRGARLIEQDFGSRLAPNRRALRMTGFHRLLANLFRRGVGNQGENAVQLPTMAVQTTSLDAFCTRLETPIDVIKVDIQGEELNLLHGAKWCLATRAVRHWVLGTHGAKIHRACVSIFRSHGYSIEFERREVEGQPDGLVVARARN